METRSRHRRRRSRSPTSIARLHESILVSILSFLPTPDAIKSSTIAKPWRDLWLWLPALEFDVRYHQESGYYSDGVARLIFADFVQRSLLRRSEHHLPLRKFKLRFFHGNGEGIWQQVDSWVERLVNLGVVDLDLDFGVEYVDDYEEDDDDDDNIIGPYEFPFSYVVRSSIQVLKLSACCLRLPGNEVMLISSIKELHLGNFYGRAGEIERLMVACVHLETLVLEYVGSSPTLNIVSNTLRRLIFTSVGDKKFVEIRTPMLQRLTCYYRLA